MKLFGRRLKRRARPTTSTANKTKTSTAKVVTPAAVQTQPEAVQTQPAGSRAQPDVTAWPEATPQQEATAQPEPTAVSGSALASSRRFNRRLIVGGVAALLVLGTLGWASTQDQSGIPTPTTAAHPSSGATVHPSAATNPPFVGSTQGCDSSFWAAPAHFPAWEEYAPDQPVGSLFGHAGTYATMTLVQAMASPTAGEDARRTLLREAVTAALNAANDSLAFPFARYDAGVAGRLPIVPTTNRLLTAGIAADIVGFANDLSQANHLSCPF